MTVTLYIFRCARIVQAMLPLVSAALEKAAASSNTVTAKSSLFSLCTSLMVGFLYTKYYILEIICPCQVDVHDKLRHGLNQCWRASPFFNTTWVYDEDINLLCYQ